MYQGQYLKQTAIINLQNLTEVLFFSQIGVGNKYDIHWFIDISYKFFAKFINLWWVISNQPCDGVPKTLATAGMEFFVLVINGWMFLSYTTLRLVFDVAGLLNMTSFERETPF